MKPTDEQLLTAAELRFGYLGHVLVTRFVSHYGEVHAVVVIDAEGQDVRDFRVLTSSSSRERLLTNLNQPFLTSERVLAFG